MEYRLRCTRCSSYQRDRAAFRCASCNSVLNVEYDYDSISLPRNFRRQRPVMGKYLRLLPLESLAAGQGEGATPLLPNPVKGYGRCSALLKLETGNPTGSFKDRGSAVEVTKALELGYDSVVCASTGNMGISVAHYARLAGLKATIFISRSANPRKAARIRKERASIVRVATDFNEAVREAERRAASGSAFVCGDYHYRKEGQKTVAYELLDQLGYRVPDLLFVPVGNATLLSALYKGAREYLALGMIERMPRLVAVQSSGCDPLVKAYNRGEKIGYLRPRTVADAIAVGYPTFGAAAIAALKKTRGMAIRVPDSRILSATRGLGAVSVRAEPGGAAGFAGFAEMYRASARALAGRSAVIVVTGKNR